MSTHLSPLRYHHSELESSNAVYQLAFLDGIDDRHNEIILRNKKNSYNTQYIISANTGFATLIEFENKQYQVYFGYKACKHTDQTQTYEFYLDDEDQQPTTEAAETIRLLREKIKASATGEIEIKVILPFNKGKYSDLTVLPSIYEVNQMIGAGIHNIATNSVYLSQQVIKINADLKRDEDGTDYLFYDFIINNLNLEPSTADRNDNGMPNRLKLGDFQFDFDFYKRGSYDLVCSWNVDIHKLIEQITIKKIGDTDLYVAVRTKKIGENRPKMYLQTNGSYNGNNLRVENLVPKHTYVFDSKLGIFRQGANNIGFDYNVTNASDVYSRVYNQRKAGDSLSSAINLSRQEFNTSLNVSDLSDRYNGWYFYTYNVTPNVISYIYSSKLFEPTNISDNQFGHLMLRVDVPKTATDNSEVEFYYGYVFGNSNLTEITWNKLMTESSKVKATQILQTDDLQFISKEDKKRWDASIQTASTWLNPVQTVNDLPSKASNGSRCVVLADNEIYRYSAGTWTIDKTELSRGTDVESNRSTAAQILTNISQAKLWQLNRSGYGFKPYENGTAVIPYHSDASKYLESTNNPYNQNWIDLVQRFNYEGTTWPEKFEPKESSINIGINNSVAGKNSVVYGSYIVNQTPNAQTVLIGNNLLRSEEEIVIGKFNKNNPDAVISFGVGSDNDTRKNAVEVLKNGTLKISGMFESSEIPANAILTNSGYLDYATVAKTEELKKYVKKSSAVIFRHVPLDFTGTEAEEIQLPEIPLYKENQ